MAHQITNPEAKRRYYRKAADEAERNAARATDPDVHRAYVAIMHTWIYLADELEREMAIADTERSMIYQSEEEGYVPPSVKGPA